MAAVTVTAALVGLIDPLKAKVKTYIAAVAITAGQPVYINSSGKVALADANAAGCYQFRGIALKSVGAGSAVDVLQEGEMYGATLSGDYDSLVYVADAVGTLVDAAGTVTIPIGRVAPLADKDLTKVLHVFTAWEVVWA